MKITKIKLNNFKFFSNLTIENINKDSEVVLLVGPNGTGKSCIFDAFNYFSFVSKRNSEARDDEYYKKDKGKPIEIVFFDENSNEISRPEFNNRSSNFYGRSSYRFTSKINRNSISTGVAKQVSNDQDAPVTYSELDQRIENDIEKALGELIQAVQVQDGKRNTDIVKNITGSLNDSLKNIFQDSNLQLNRIVDPHSDPSNSKIDLEFIKNGTVFSFRNLSSGEKEVVDIIFNFHRRKENWIKDGIYFIDEPELHLNTRIQALLLKELHKLCREINSQLWVATHSLGFLRAAQDIKKNNKNSVSVIEFKQDLSDSSDHVQPILGTRYDWKRIFKTALEDITGLVSPNIIIYCEGKMTRSLDEKMFNSIFSDKDDCLFVSATNKADSIKYAGVALTVLNKAFDGVEIKNLVDRDDNQKVPNNSCVKLCKLKRREFENYLCDFEIISKAFPDFKEDIYDSVVSDIINDDVDSKIPELISLSGVNMSEKDFKIKLSENITPDTEVYKELERIIF